MAIRNGFQSIRVPLNNIPNTQASGVWSGSSNPVTLLDKGVYFLNYNVSYQAINGPITNSQTVITSNASFVSTLGQIIASTPLTGAMGVTGSSSMRQTLSNTFNITADNTPIYVYLSCTLTGTWGTINANEGALNTISFTRIGSL